MFTTKIKIITVLSFMLVASTAFAQGTAPAVVTGISAQAANGTVTVKWNAVTGASSYRIYYSRESILQNGGDYDDFESVDGTKTSFTFNSPPYTGRTLYFSVLAVNSQGTESEGFAEEASAAIPAVTSSSAAAAASSSAIASSTSSQAVDDLVLIGATPLSSTGVSLEFSKPLDTAQVLQGENFLIVDSSGAQLDVTGFEIAGKEILVETAVQENGRAYIVGILQDIRSTTGGGLNDSSLQQASFVAIGGGVAASRSSSNASSAASSAAPVDRRPPENPDSLDLRALIRPDGTYDVSAVWAGSINSVKDLSGYRVYASTDGLKFQPSTTTDNKTTATRYTSVKPGTFGVRVTAFDTTGNESSGIQKVINLPNSGLGLFGLIAASAGVAGQRAYRKRRGRK